MILYMYIHSFVRSFIHVFIRVYIYIYVQIFHILVTAEGPAVLKERFGNFPETLPGWSCRDLAAGSG